MIGGAIGATYSTLKREVSEPVPEPPIEEPKGFRNKVKYNMRRARYKSDRFQRRHPVAATMLATGAGAAAGASVNLGSGARELGKTSKGKI